MAMVDVDGSSHLSADSQLKSVDLVCGLAATPALSLHSSNELGELHAVRTTIAKRLNRPSWFLEWRLPSVCNSGIS